MTISRAKSTRIWADKNNSKASWRQNRENDGCRLCETADRPSWQPYAGASRTFSGRFPGARLLKFLFVEVLDSPPQKSLSAIECGDFQRSRLSTTETLNDRNSQRTPWTPGPETYFDKTIAIRRGRFSTCSLSIFCPFEFVKQKPVSENAIQSIHFALDCILLCFA